MCFQAENVTDHLCFFKFWTPLRLAQGTHFWVLKTQGRENLKLGLWNSSLYELKH